MSDLTPVLKEIEKILQDKFGGTPGAVLVFTVPPDYKTVNYVSNVKSVDAIRLLGNTADKLLAELK